MDPFKGTDKGNPHEGLIRHLRKYPDVVIARVVGILCIASGFIIGIHGLDHPDTSWLRTALGLIVTGLLAQGYALIRTVTRLHTADRHKDER